MAEDSPRRRVPLPGRLVGGGARGAEAVARATGIDQALEDAVVRVAESQAFEQALERVLRGPIVEEAVAAAITSPSVERSLEEALDSEMVDRIWAQLLASDEVQKLVERIAEAPEVRAAITQQGVGFVQDLADGAQRVARRLDRGLERVARRLLRRPQREGETDTAGGVTRLVALVLDGALLNVLLLGLSALIRDLLEAVGIDASNIVVVALGVAGWALAAALYLIAFWALVGRTPGMYFLGITLHDFDESRRIGLRAATKRLAGLVIGTFALLLGEIGILTTERRLGLQDRWGGTEVRYDGDAGPKAAPHSNVSAEVRG